MLKQLITAGALGLAAMPAQVNNTATPAIATPGWSADRQLAGREETDDRRQAARYAVARAVPVRLPVLTTPP